MVIIVLLKVELTWATPETMFLRSRRRTRVFQLPFTLSSLLLLAGNGFSRAFARACIGVCTLAAHRQIPTVA
jgi:hypothetical protein